MKVYSKKYSRVVFGKYSTFQKPVATLTAKISNTPLHRTHAGILLACAGDDDPSVRATSEAREAMKNGSNPAGIRRGAEQHVAGRDCEIIPKRQLKPAPEGVAAGKTRIHLARDDAPAMPSTGLGQGDLNESLTIQQNGFYEESPAAGTSSTLHAYRRENIPTRYMGGAKPPSTISISQDDSLRLPESSQQESFLCAIDPQLATQAHDSIVCGVTSAQQNHVKDHMRMTSPPVRPAPKFRYDKIVVIGSELAPDQKFPVESERTEVLRITAEKASRGPRQTSCGHFRQLAFSFT
jgi:hypothetical protein